LQRYPLTNYPSPSIALATVQTDAETPLSSCEHLTSYRLVSAGPVSVPVYAYQFVDRTAPPLVDVPNFEEGAEHAVELNFLFPNLFSRPYCPAQALAALMVKYWTNFAHAGNPNGGDGPKVAAVPVSDGRAGPWPGYAPPTLPRRASVTFGNHCRIERSPPS